jgi:hypothetical protein
MQSAVLMEEVPKVLNAKERSKFEVECRAGSAGSLQVGSETLSIQIGQRLLRGGSEEMWHSVAVYANEDDKGNLVIRVLVFNPDWDEPLQIARITSRPDDASCRTALGCNLDHVKG